MEVGEYEITCCALASDDGSNLYKGTQLATVESGVTSEVTIVLEKVYTITFKNSATDDIYFYECFINRPFKLPNVSNIFSNDDYTFEKFEYTGLVNGTTQTMNYQIGDEFTLQDSNYLTIKALYKRNPTQIGYIAYSDNTTSKNYVPGKTVIGIVIGLSESNSAKKIMSIQESEACVWNSNYADNSITGIRSQTDGSYSMKLFTENPEYQFDLDALWNANNCAPTTQGWYIPASSELLTIYSNMSLLNSTIDKLAAGGMAKKISKNRYWSCSLSGNDNKLVVIDMNESSSTAAKKSADFDDECYVRCVANFNEANYPNF